MFERLLRFLHLVKNPPAYFDPEVEDSEEMETEVERRRGMRGL